MNNFAVMFAVCLLVGAERFVTAKGFSGEDENCSYTIKIETTCTLGADTSDRISLRFGDSNSTDVLVRHLNPKQVRRVDRNGLTILDDIARKPFQVCGTDEFQVVGPCVRSTVCYLYLKQRGKDDWRPGFSSVIVHGAPKFSSKPFYFRRYLPRHVWHGDDKCDTEVTPYGIKHVRKVFSSKPH